LVKTTVHLPHVELSPTAPSPEHHLGPRRRALRKRAGFDQQTWGFQRQIEGFKQQKFGWISPRKHGDLINKTEDITEWGFNGDLLVV